MRVALLALCFPVLCLAQSAMQPRLVLPAPHHDFGQVGPDTPVTHRFQATNAGTAMLTISQVKPTCGCTSSVAGKRTLAPGESTELEVTFHPEGSRGLTRKSVAVLSDDPVQPVQTLTFDATVLPAVIASTDQVRFDDLLPTDERKASVKLETGTREPLRLLNVEMSDAPWLGVTTRETGKELWVDLDLLARRLPGDKPNGIDTVTLHLSNPQSSAVTVNVFWEMRAPVITVPARVAWAEPAGKVLRAQVMLEQRQSKPFRILSARTSNPLLQVNILPPTRIGRQGIELLLSSAARPGQYAEKAFLTLDTPGHPEVEVRVSASLR
jgi:hypothetical protein